jgi:branched-chain amino acid aminotransferase
MVLRGYGDAGMMPGVSPIETFIACWPWGTYLGDGALEQGVDVCVSTWQRPAPNTFPALAKAAGHYNNAQLIKMEAMANGYVEAIALAPNGLVSEGSGQNVFLVRDGILRTTAVDGTILSGITRASIITLARDLGIEVERGAIPREMLYTADEVFFTGTAAEVTPIRSIDRIEIGAGSAGPITRVLQKRFLDIVHGRAADDHGWLMYVESIPGAVEGAAEVRSATAR